MTESKSVGLSSSINRTIFGVLLTILAILGIGMARQLIGGKVAIGIIGVGITLLCSSVIIYIIYEGIREGQK